MEGTQSDLTPEQAASIREAAPFFVGLHNAIVWSWWGFWFPCLVVGTVLWWVKFH
jgi:hypothetical protein